MRVDIITLFPTMFNGPFTESIIKRAQTAGSVNLHLHQLRDSASDKHQTVDDSPYGGGAGMVLKVDVLDVAITNTIETGRKALGKEAQPHVILLTPQGKLFKQEIARALIQKSWLILICGHYEGFDERVRSLVDAEISIGDYVLTGGELPAMVITDAIVRLLPGALGKEASHQEESHENGLLEYPHYTRPDEYNGGKVPDILLSGDHARIAAWRKEESQKRTTKRRLGNSDQTLTEHLDIG